MESPDAVCVTFRYPDGSRDFLYLDVLPIGGEAVMRHGTPYVVAAIDTDGADNTIVTLEPAPLAEPDGDLVELPHA